MGLAVIKRTAAIGLLASAGFSDAAFANRRESADQLTRLALDRSLLGSRDGRDKIVGVVGAYCTEFGDLIPRNSPAEDAWLRGEITAGGDRTRRALGSIEFSRRQASNFVSDCLAGTQLYQSGDRQSGLSLLVYGFARFDALEHAQRIMISADSFTLALASVHLEGLAYAALQEAMSERE